MPGKHLLTVKICIYGGYNILRKPDFVTLSNSNNE